MEDCHDKMKTSMVINDAATLLQRFPEESSSSGSDHVSNDINMNASSVAFVESDKDTN